LERLRGGGKTFKSQRIYTGSWGQREFGMSTVSRALDWNAELKADGPTLSNRRGFKSYAAGRL